MTQTVAPEARYARRAIALATFLTLVPLTLVVAGLNEPVPVPSSTETLFELLFATARSAVPFALRSAASRLSASQAEKQQALTRCSRMSRPSRGRPMAKSLPSSLAIRAASA